MKYKESSIDKELRDWFLNDYSKALLRKIVLKEGCLRGITDLDIEFSYPITAFAGINGAGKSTILAMACCAYHARPDGYKNPKRKYPYYTFSEFFIQHSDEIPPAGLEINYYIAHDSWKKTEKLPNGIGIGMQSRKKSKGGKWNDYASRVKKCVVFMGIDRIVPHNERSPSRSYSKAFKAITQKGWENKVKDAVGYILGKSYDEFRLLEHSKYSLPLVRLGDITYSGFNMGAGENALFEIFSTIYSCGENSLIVIDEIELGLHSKAQKKFIKKLKDVCKETGTQVICTTHSKDIFDSLPDEARVYIESVNNKTKTTIGISSDFAFSKMSGNKSIELEIFVEDKVAESIILSLLPANIRSRIKIHVIGSASAISRQLAATWIKDKRSSVIAIFDGDQKSKNNNNLKTANSMIENHNEDFKKWFAERACFLPGDVWPERYIISKCKEALSETKDLLALDDENDAAEYLQHATQAGKHSEFYELSNYVGLPSEDCVKKLCSLVTNKFSNEFQELTEKIRSFLP